MTIGGFTRRSVAGCWSRTTFRVFQAFPEAWCKRGSYQIECFRVSDLQEFQVSSSGQMSLPASARHRWDLDRGGPVDVLDLGFGVLTVPKGQGRRLLADLLSREDHAAFVGSLAGDPDLATT